MSYFKQVLVCQDYGLGLNTINQARQNLEQFLTDWGTEHASVPELVQAGSPLQLQDRYNWFGTHNVRNVARAIVEVDVATALGAVLQISAVEAPPVVFAVNRLSKGVWFISMAGKLTFFLGDPVPLQPDATAARFCVVRTPDSSNGGAAGSTGNGFIVTTYELAAGDFALTDYSFSCGIYSYV